MGYIPLDQAAYLAFDADLQNGRNWVLDITRLEWSEETSHTFLIRAVVQYTETKSIEVLSGELIEMSSSASTEGLGIFMGSTGSIMMDFLEGDEPDQDSLINVVGAVEELDGTNEIDVSYWYYDGEEPPAPPNYASSVLEADSLPLGSICYILGSITSWTNETDGMGEFDDGSDNIAIGFGGTLPETGNSIYILGRIAVENSVKKGASAGTRMIEAYTWIGAGDGTGTESLAGLNPNIQVYPNPAVNILYIDSEEPISRVILHSITGEIMKDISHSGIATIDVSNLNSGVYIISLFNENEYLGSKRLVKE